jgi:hypothetical protein
MHDFGRHVRERHRLKLRQQLAGFHDGIDADVRAPDMRLGAVDRDLDQAVPRIGNRQVHAPVAGRRILVISFTRR